MKKLPGVGMRNLKTAVAVTACFFLFLPLQGVDLPAGANMGPFYACIAAVICMQSSVEQSLRQGVSRMMGTLLGGGAGLLILLLGDRLNHPVFTGALLGAGVVFTIWLCNALRRPAACAISCIVLCVVVLNHSGADRYVYTVVRMGETVVGIAVALAVNRLLPGEGAVKPGAQQGKQSSVS